MRQFLSMILMMPALLAAQPQQSSRAAARDTSFTVQSTAAKLRNQFPSARIAEPPLPDGVLDFNTPDEFGADSVTGKTKTASLWFGGTIYEKPHLSVEASPITHVGPSTSPIAFINSGQERYHFGRDAMIEKLNSLGIYSEVHTIPDTPHPFWLFEPWFDATCRHVTTFLDQNLRTPSHR